MSIKPDPHSLNAVPETEDFRHKYTEEGSGKIGARLLNNYFVNVQKLIQAAGLDTSKKLKAIEIGCGEGYSTQRLGTLLPNNIQLEASEYVAHQIPYAQNLNPNIRITEESAYDLQHRDATFGLVFLLEVLEHLDYPGKALAEIKRVLKPGGCLILGVPREPIWRALNMARGTYLQDFGNTPGHLNHWSKRSLIAEINRNFGVVEVVKTPLPWTLVLARKQL